MTGPDANLTKTILACWVFKTIVNVLYILLVHIIVKNICFVSRSRNVFVNLK
jgi:hypothetical protein